MKPTFALNSKLAILGLFAASLTATAAKPAFWSWARTPPMGWNSWDCYGAGVWESNVMVDRQHFLIRRRQAHGRFGQFRLVGEPASGQDFSAPGPFDENAPHRLGGGAKEVRAVLPGLPSAGDQPQPGFVDQGRGRSAALCVCPLASLNWRFVAHGG